MKKYLIIALIALVAYLVFFKKKDETTTTTTQKTEEDEPYVPEDNTEKHTPVVTTKTTTEPCPYCGTAGAKVTRTYTDGKMTKRYVNCGNKDCVSYHKTEFKSTKLGTTNTNQSNK